MHGLGKLGIKPYYLYYADLVEGTGHFRTEVYKGKEICRDLCGSTTGFLRPQYVVDAQGDPQLRQVRVGRKQGDNVEVVAGLLAGEKLALDPIAAANFKTKKLLKK